MKLGLPILVTVLFSAGAIAVLIWLGVPERYVFRPTETYLDVGITIDASEVVRESASDVASTEPITIVAENLSIPWEIVFLPNGDMLVTERSGILRIISEEGVQIALDGVQHAGEGGLLGLVLHPDFLNNEQLYLYFTSKKEKGFENRIERYTFDGKSLSNKQIILDNIPGATYHDGGRLAFGPDSKLYATTGDAGHPELAQDLDSLAGKVLRMNDDGSIPEGNPFETLVWSYGHRNSQGLAWDEEGNLWSSEHGRSGRLSGMDEVNLIEAGKNYGWPDIEGSELKLGMTGPVVHSGPDETWAPGDIAVLGNRIFFTGLRGESLYELGIAGNNEKEEVRVHFRKDFGRLRVVEIGPDGFLYIATSNTDGRGTTQDGDDKIIRIDPKLFE